MNLRELLKSDTIAAIKRDARVNESKASIATVEKQKKQKRTLLASLEAIGDQSDGDKRRIKALRAEIEALNGKLDKMESKLDEGQFKDYVASKDELEEELATAKKSMALYRQQGNAPMAAKMENRIKQIEEKLKK